MAEHNHNADTTHSTLPIHGSIDPTTAAQRNPSASQNNNLLFENKNSRLSQNNNSDSSRTNDSIPSQNIGVHSSANNPYPSSNNTSRPSQDNNSIPAQNIATTPPVHNKTSNPTTINPSPLPSNNTATTSSSHNTTPIPTSTSNIKNVPPHIKILNPPSGDEIKDWKTMTLAERLEATTDLPLTGFEEYEWKVENEKACLEIWRPRQRKNWREKDCSMCRERGREF